MSECHARSVPELTCFPPFSAQAGVDIARGGGELAFDVPSRPPSVWSDVLFLSLWCATIAMWVLNRTATDDVLTHPRLRC